VAGDNEAPTTVKPRAFATPPRDVLQALAAAPLTAAELRVALALADRVYGFQADQGKHQPVTVAQLTEATGLWRSQVTNALARLSGPLGVLEVDRTKGRVPNRYGFRNTGDWTVNSPRIMDGRPSTDHGRLRASNRPRIVDPLKEHALRTTGKHEKNLKGTLSRSLNNPGKVDGLAAHPSVRDPDRAARNAAEAKKFLEEGISSAAIQRHLQEAAAG
jgi:hypothetical protein